MSTAFSVCCGSRYTGGHALATSQIDCERVPVIDTMSLEQLPDEELVKQFRLSTQAEAREQNVNELFRRNYARVARWCPRFADNRESAADLAQEVFAKAYQNLHSFQGQSKFTTWLFVIAKGPLLEFGTSAVSPGLRAGCGGWRGHSSGTPGRRSASLCGRGAWRPFLCSNGLPFLQACHSFMS